MQKEYSGVPPLLTILLLISLLLLPSCAFFPSSSRYVEYEKVDQELLGKVIRFKKPMVYAYLPETDVELSGVEIEGVEINRMILNETLSFANYKYEWIPEGMEFTVMEGSYRIGYRQKLFPPDGSHYLILRDENGLYSACEMIYLKLDSDIKG